MRLKIAVLLILTSLLSTLFSQELYMKESVKQGEMITFVVSPVEDDIEYSFNIYNRNGKRVLSFKGFNYYLYEKMTPVILGLGGIPSDLPVGEYKIKASGKGILTSNFFERPLTVTDGEYKETRFEASSEMDDIINGVIDKERKSQSERLWDAISRFSPYILHEEGVLKQPVKGKHTSPFGFSRITVFPDGSENSSIHHGEDLAIKLGTPVLSDGRGIVLLAESRIVTGNTVVVEHLPGVVTIYYHMDSLNVERGDYVEKGDKIGEVGSTGYSTGPHLHWEVRVSTVPVNPMIFLDTPLIDKTLIINNINDTNIKKGG